MDTIHPYHRLLGLLWLDFFDERQLSTEVEIDLSQKKQFLDFALVRQQPGPFPFQLPDGLEPLAAHNLITFKSYQEPLDGFAIIELLGHYANYRKQKLSPQQQMLPEEDFRLIALAARLPRELQSEGWLERVAQGVYNLAYPARGRMRVIVIHELPLEPQNALLLLFSAQPEQVRYAQQHYQLRSADASTVLQQLFTRYREEGIEVGNQLREFAIEVYREKLQKMTPEERRKVLSVEERLDDLSPEEVLRGLSPEKRLALQQLLGAQTPPEASSE